MIKNYVEVKRTARYFQSKEMDNKVKHLLFVLHGYAQNGDVFLESFKKLENEEIIIVAPEGLSKFYWEDFSSNPVSSWMTSLERDNEIKDTLNYLNEIVKVFADEGLNNNIQLHILGFSQGAATASRFVAQSLLTFKSLFLYAGSFAHDLDWELLRKNQCKLTCHLIYGTEDLLISKDKVKQAKLILEKENMSTRIFSFKGKHKIDKEAVNYLMDIIQS